jgi:hypothetical protein
MQNSRCMRRNTRWTKTFFAAEPPANLSFSFRGISTAKKRRVQKKRFFAVLKSKRIILCLCVLWINLASPLPSTQREERLRERERSPDSWLLKGGGGCWSRFQRRGRKARRSLSTVLALNGSVPSVAAVFMIKNSEDLTQILLKIFHFDHLNLWSINILQYTTDRVEKPCRHTLHLYDMNIMNIGNLWRYIYMDM